MILLFLIISFIIIIVLIIYSLVFIINQIKNPNFEKIYKFLFQLGHVSFLLGQHRIERKKVRLEFMNFPDNLNGLRIIQISDCHVYLDGNFNNDMLNRAIKKTNSLNPDIVILSGDITDIYSPKVLEISSSLIKKIKCRTKIGIFGSHDFCHPLTENKIKIIQKYEKVGLKMICNEKFTPDLFPDLEFFGFGSYLRKDCKPENIYNNFETNKFAIGISHNPDSLHLIRDFTPKLNLILMGHTHGGQVCIPFTKTPIFVCVSRIFRNQRLSRKVNSVVKDWRYSQGLFFEEEEKYVYVNRGIGSHCNVRFFCRPEITEFILKKKKK